MPLKEAFEKQQQSVLVQYGKALDSIMTDLKRKGDLDGVLILQAEQERLAAERTIPAPTDAKDAFRRAFEVYHKAMITALEQYVMNMDQLIKKEVQLTK